MEQSTNVSLRLHVLFEVFADHPCDVLTVLLGGAEHETRVSRNDFSHQSDDVIWVDLLHRTRVLGSQTSDMQSGTLESSFALKVKPHLSVYL